jgi:hypothetical protein
MKKYFLYAIIVVGVGVFAASFFPQLRPGQIPTNNGAGIEVIGDAGTASPFGAESASKNYKIVSSSIATVQDSDANGSITSNTSSEPTPTQTPSQKTSEISVTFKIRKNTYTISVPKDSTVLEAMMLLDKDTKQNFSFKSSTYSSMGQFVTEINSIKSTNEYFWVYYVNDTQANLGVSNYKIKSGDTIQWKLEDSNKKEIL